MTVRSSFADLCVGDVRVSVAFYRRLLGFDVIVDHGWYAELGVDGQVLLALVAAGHETVPDGVGGGPRGVLVSFEVDDIATHVRAAEAMGCTVAVERTRELGQDHCMVLDPDGATVDIIERVPLTRADVARLARLRRQHPARST